MKKKKKRALDKPSESSPARAQLSLCPKSRVYGSRNTSWSCSGGGMRHTGSQPNPLCCPSHSQSGGNNETLFSLTHIHTLPLFSHGFVTYTPQPPSTGGGYQSTRSSSSPPPLHYKAYRKALEVLLFE